MNFAAKLQIKIGLTKRQPDFFYYQERWFYYMLTPTDILFLKPFYSLDVLDSSVL